MLGGRTLRVRYAAKAPKPLPKSRPPGGRNGPGGARGAGGGGGGGWWVLPSAEQNGGGLAAKLAQKQAEALSAPGAEATDSSVSGAM